jgi:hypothetical protein
MRWRGGALAAIAALLLLTGGTPAHAVTKAKKCKSAKAGTVTVTSIRVGGLKCRAARRFARLWVTMPDIRPQLAAEYGLRCVERPVSDAPTILYVRCHKAPGVRARSIRFRYPA